jgi:hypothetical protein
MEIVTRERSWGVFWHGASGLVVEHTVPVAGIHKFRALPKHLRLGARVLGRAASPGEVAPGIPEGEVEQSAYERARSQALEKNGSGAVEILVDSGLPRVTAKALVEALDVAETTTTIAFIDHREGVSISALRGMTALVAPLGSFLLWPLDAEEGEKQVGVRPLDRASWREAVNGETRRLTQNQGQ